MTDFELPPLRPSSPPPPGWVRRHKLLTAILVLAVLVVFGTVVAPSSKPTGSVKFPAPALSATPSATPTIHPSTQAPTAAPTKAPSRGPSQSPVTAQPVTSLAASTAVPAPVRTTAPPRPPSLTCQASVSNPTPPQNSTEDVFVTVGKPNVGVTIVDHYKSKDSTYSGVTGGDGKADISFRISRATVGYTVVVDVTVTGGPSCQTSFTPQ